MTLFWVLLLFAAGMVLVFAEFFLPGLILGTVGVVLIVISVAMGISAFPDYATFIIIGAMAGSAGALGMGFWTLTRTRAAGMLQQQLSQKAEEGYVSAESDLSILGREGTVLTALRPAGTVQIGDKRVDAVSDGVFIEEDRRVRVTEVRGSRVVVESAE